ncbi:hypothetical protein AVEN_247525-1 [Araneus ventricosus]|uniref:Uncharacterized protein n=1 Tax=Araneus ventricosus TaxID=182803 RepID=A0A4Y2PRG1_ARAVE|nr:hypothetical protein AVEN_247525-1 [Araneus ventricosus]
MQICKNEITYLGFELDKSGYSPSAENVRKDSKFPIPKNVKEVQSYLDLYQQAIVYQDGQEEEAVARVATRQTTITAWFELNKNYQDSHNYLYKDIPHYYTFNKSAMKWQKRQRGGE